MFMEPFRLRKLEQGLIFLYFEMHTFHCAATGVSDGDLLQGVRYSAGGATSHSLVMRSRSGTIRYRPAITDACTRGMCANVANRSFLHARTKRILANGSFLHADMSRQSTDGTSPASPTFRGIVN